MDFALIFKALSNENRLKVFEIIRAGHGNIVECRRESRPDNIPQNAVCVCEILEQMDVTAPTLSHHLKELRIAGIVNVYNRGQWSYYNLLEGVLEKLAGYFNGADSTNKGRSFQMGIKTSESIKENVRKNYGSIAKGEKRGCCGPSPCGGADDAEQESLNKFLISKASDPGSVAKKLGYSDDELSALPEEANLGLGCGNPTAIASLRPGDVVLDLGSGAGMDCFLAAVKVGPEGKVIGVDMTPEMVEKANKNLGASEFRNIEFRHGEIESLPVDDDSVDVVISNCVLNLVPDKLKAFQEIFRVLKPGGGMAVSDIVKLKKLPDVVQNDPDAVSACIAGALMRDEYLSAISRAGLSNVKVVSEQDFGDMFFATEGPVSEKITEVFEGGDASGYIASIKVTARKTA